jgi:hypothetical protein
MIVLRNLRVGSIVILRPAFGDGMPIEAKVIEVDPDIANGRAGVTYSQSTTTALHWAYLDQIDKVVKY